MGKYVLTLLLTTLMAACSAFAPPTPADSGIEGQVMIGPMCPVIREGQECPDQPYQAWLTVTSPEGEKIVRFQTDEGGHFRVPLAPGEYILRPESPEGMPYPFANDQRVTVLPGQFTRITVIYDSGIR